jgi:16S rRNA processing protein RimM
MSPSPPPYDPETIAIGVLGKPHGVRGEIALRLFNAEGSPLADPDGLDADVLILERDGKRVTRAVTNLRPCANGWLITFEGIDSRDEAAALTHSQVRLPRDALPPPEPGEYYVSDVIGCQVLAHDGGAPLGVVEETFWNGAHDVMIVRGDAGAERLIPLVPDFVREVDAAGRTIRVAWNG